MQNDNNYGNPQIDEEDKKVLEEIIKIRKEYDDNPQKAEELINEITSKAIERKKQRQAEEQKKQAEEKEKQAEKEDDIVFTINGEVIDAEEELARDSGLSNSDDVIFSINSTRRSSNLKEPLPSHNADGVPHVVKNQDDMHPHRISGFGMSEADRFVTDEYFHYYEDVEIDDNDNLNLEDDLDTPLNINEERNKNDAILEKKKITRGSRTPHPTPITNEDGTPFLNTKQNGKEFEVEINEAYPKEIKDYVSTAEASREIKLDQELNVKVFNGTLNIEDNYVDKAETTDKQYSLHNDQQNKTFDDMGYIPPDKDAEKRIDAILNNLEPNKDKLEADINKIAKKNKDVITNVHTTEEYKNNAKELLDALKKDLDVKLLSELEPRYTKNLPAYLVKDENTVFLNSNRLDGTDGIYLNTVRDKIVGKKNVSIEEYKDLLTKYARINKINLNSAYDKNDPENKKAFDEQMDALAKANSILAYRGFSTAFLANVDTNEKEITEWATAIVKKDELAMNQKFVEDHPIPEDIIEETNIAIRTIFGCGELKYLSKKQLEAYNYVHNNTTGEIKNIDQNLLDEAEKIMNGSSINLTNMKQAFWKLHSLQYLQEMTSKYGSATNFNSLCTAINQTKEFLLKKNIGLDDIEKLTKLSNKDNIEAENPEFDKLAEKILLKNEAARISKTPIKDAIDKFYTELAVTFDAANNKFGADLTNESFVSSAKTFKKMYDLQTALTEMNSTDALKDISRNVAKVEKFLLLKGFTETEIKKIKEPRIFEENKDGLDGFQILAEYHWDKYADINKDLEASENKEINNITNDVTKDVASTRTKITVDIEDKNKIPEEKEPFDLSNEIVRERTKNIDTPENTTTENTNEISTDTGKMVQSKPSDINNLGDL